MAAITKYVEASIIEILVPIFRSDGKLTLCHQMVYNSIDDLDAPGTEDTAVS